MATLPTQSFATIVSNITAGIQGRAIKIVNFSQGSSVRAIVEGFAGVFLWFQALILQVLTATRLSTSKGNDVDTFTADFMPIIPGSQTTALPGGSPRLGAQASSGQVIFSRFTAGPSSVFVPVGTSVQTNDGSVTFAVTADPTNGSYSATPAPGGYIMPSSVGSVVVPVQCTTPGVGGNVVATSISVMTSPITGVDMVQNPAAFLNGANFESDSALKARFAAYILGLSRGDLYGLTSSIEGVDITIQWTLTEGYNYDGSYRPGYFFVVADDGSGSPSPAFLTAALNAAIAVRPLGVQCQVFPPVIITADVSMQLKTSPLFDHNTVVAQVKALVATNINSLGLGVGLPWTLVSSWPYAIPGVIAVDAVFLNQATGDAASLSTTFLTQDQHSTINYATIKARTMSIS
jgi:hypothetical protein